MEANNLIEHDIIWFNDNKHPNNNVVKASEVISHIANHCYRIAYEHGFHEKGLNVGEKIALIHSELSEALEAARKPRVSEHVPGMDTFTEELADVVIRVFDLAVLCGCQSIGDVMIEKMIYNNKRPFMHGKKF